MLTSISLKDKITAEASRLGFFVCGFAMAEPVSEAMRRHYLGWLADGRNADMAYLGNNLDKRFDPRLLMPGVKTIVVVAQNYFPARRLPEGEPQIADYALGLDYHDIVKQKLRQLAATVGIAGALLGRPSRTGMDRQEPAAHYPPRGQRVLPRRTVCHRRTSARRAIAQPLRHMPPLR